MGLDLYVMPLHRFFARDFDPPLARLGMPFKRIGPSGEVPVPRAGSAGPAEINVGRHKSANIRAKVAEANRVPIDWPDEGEVVFTEQAQGSGLGLHTFATWLDYGDKLPEFEVMADDRYDRHPVRRIERTLHRAPTFPHLVQHSLYVGYFLPCDFVKPVVVRTIHHGSISLPVQAGSTPRLVAELEAINDLLRVPEDYPARWQEFESHPYRLIIMAFDQIRRAARLSLQHRLPLIFEG
ncbi:MAG: hypothetical protein IT436_16385 [Phycisphaerales bacterium]|nr:hypothetical protein [Phycisphaerales bacterium]